jgi:hypothetical protein
MKTRSYTILACLLLIGAVGVSTYVASQDGNSPFGEALTTAHTD